jgi:hypothetical protein
MAMTGATKKPATPPGLFRKKFPGLVWSNPNAPDEAYIRAALIRPRFLVLLDMAATVGLDKIKREWSVLERESSDEARRATKYVRRILKNMSDGAR